MGDRYLYDASGRYVGMSSDRPPDSNCGCFGVLFCVAVVVGVIKTLIAMIYPLPDLTPQLLGRWKNDRGGIVVQYAPDHTYTVTEVKDGKTREQGTWRLDDKTLFYWISADSPSDAKESGSHYINQLDGKALVMDQAMFEKVEAGR